ncbi:MAG: hypothetical protein PV344_05175, partial [Anaplasma sp.]|nr:hypothetical protein [Anaplasma sp.]
NMPRKKTVFALFFVRAAASHNFDKYLRIFILNAYCKRLNFRRDLIFANFANRLRFAKNRSREKFGQ